jgi:hypothetical protein
MIQSGADFPVVDYAAHPAFRGFAAAPAAKDAAVEQAVGKADAALEEIYASPTALPVAGIEDHYRQNVRPNLDEIRRLCLDQLPNGSLLGKVVGDALEETHQDLLRALCYQNEKKRYRPANRVAGVAEQVAADLSEKGISLHRIPDQTIRAILDDVEPLRERLLELSTRNEGDRCSLALPPSGRYWKELGSYLDRCGILAGCSHSRREPLELNQCGLILSHDQEQWWRDCYKDVGTATSRTTYMHNDKDFDYMKVLVYLSEVDEAKGPFAFIPGSHKWRRSRTQSFLFKALDYAFNSNLTPREPSRTVYYRKAFRHAEFREQFMMLPRALRGSSHFGDDILDGSDVSQRLLAQEMSITTDVANCMAFTGADGIHRGGCVTEGRRWCLQLFLKMTPPVHRRIERSAKAAYSLTRSKLRGAVRHVLRDRGIQAARSLVHRVTGQ